MTLSIEQIIEQAMQLPAASRAEMAEQLVASLPENEETRKLWAAEAIRRRDAVRSGAVKPIPGEQVLAEVRRVVGR